MGLIPGLAQWVKDPALLQLGNESQLWLGFDPGNFQMLQVWIKKKKKTDVRVTIRCHLQKHFLNSKAAQHWYRGFYLPQSYKHVSLLLMIEIRRAAIY